MYLAIIILPLLGSIVSGFFIQPFFYSTNKLDYLFTELKAKLNLHFCILIALFFNLFIIIFSGNAWVITSLLILLVSLPVLYYLVFLANNFKRDCPVLYKYLLFFFFSYNYSFLIMYFFYSYFISICHL